jgi:hypothetical protein
MRVRKLRSTLSVLSAAASLLLILLWVRSYYRFDTIRGFGLEIRSGFGITMCLGRDSPANLRFSSQALDDWSRNHRPFKPSLLFKGGGRFGNHFWFAIPYWFLVAISTTCAAVAAAPWLGWQFSLRILIITMTLIAIALGLSSFALRQ